MPSVLEASAAKQHEKLKQNAQPKNVTDRFLVRTFSSTTGLEEFLNLMSPGWQLTLIQPAWRSGECLVVLERD